MTRTIRCQDLDKNYSGRRALDGLNLEFDTTAPTGLVGANGAGKSTLFGILCGFIRPSRGEVSVFGKPPTSAALKGKISILPQDTAMYRHISVYTQLRHLARLQGFSRREVAMEVERVLSAVSATAFSRQYPETLSFGQRKKVMLAQALIGSPQLILLDEPTSGLDPVATREVHQLLAELATSYSVVISSHNLGEIEGICRQIVVINQGKLVKTGPIDEIKRVSQCFRLKLETAPSIDLCQLLDGLAEVVRVEPDSGNNRQYRVFYAEGRAHEAQIGVLSRLNTENIEVAEFSRGAALADEISSLLR